MAKPSAPDFDEVIAAAEKLTTEYLIDTKKSLPPTWYFFTDDGKVEVHITAWHDDIEKEVMCAVLRAALRDPKYIAYACISEMWVSRRGISDLQLTVRPRDDPKRQEGVVCYVCTRTERAQRAWDIVRDYKGMIRMLRPWNSAVREPVSEAGVLRGRFVEMFEAP
jgi:hypothetical protein